MTYLRKPAYKIVIVCKRVLDIRHKSKLTTMQQHDAHVFRFTRLDMWT